MQGQQTRAGGFPPGRPRRLLCAVLLLAAALRAGALDKPLYIDEIVTITVASAPLARMSETMREIDASPILYPLLLHLWMEASRADVWVRLLSAVFGLLAVLAVAGLTSRAFGWRAGLAAGFVMAIAPAHIHYAQYVRSYSLFTLLASLHVWLLMAWLDEGGSRGRAALVVLATAALLYTHYLAVLLFAGEALVCAWLVRDRRRDVLQWGGCVALSSVLFVPGVPLLLHNVSFDRIRNQDRPSPAPLFQLAPDIALELMVGQRSLGFQNPDVRRATLAAAAVLFPALWTVGLVRAARSESRTALLLCAVSLVPIALYLGSGRKLVAVRFFVPFAAGYLALIGYGLASLRGAVRWTATAALVVVCAIPLHHFYTAFAWSYDHCRVARAIEERSAPGDVILVTHPYEALYFRWYLGDRLPVRGLLFTPIDEQDSYVIKPPAIRLDRAQARVREAAGQYRRFWIVGQTQRSFASDAAEEARILAWLDATYRRADDLGALTGSDPVIRLYDAGGAAQSGLTH